MDARGYGALRPYVVPATLEELTGPTEGVVVLPRHLDWGPERRYHLDQIADARLMYMRVIRESATPDDLRRFLWKSAPSSTSTTSQAARWKPSSPEPKSATSSTSTHS